MGVSVTITLNEERCEILQKRGMNIAKNDEVRDYVLACVDKDLNQGEQKSEE